MEIAAKSCEKASAAVELFIRSSLVLPRRPAVLLMDAQVDQGAKASLSVISNRNRRWVGGGGGGHLGGEEMKLGGGDVMFYLRGRV